MFTGVAFPNFGELYDPLREDERFDVIAAYMALPEE